MPMPMVFMPLMCDCSRQPMGFSVSIGPPFDLTTAVSTSPIAPSRSRRWMVLSHFRVIGLGTIWQMSSGCFCDSASISAASVASIAMRASVMTCLSFWSAAMTIVLCV